MDGNDTNKLVKGAFLLTLAGFIGKLLSAGYRIPLQNLTGDVGFYIYQQVYPILGMVLVLGLYGFPSAISRLTAEMEEAGKGRSFRSFVVPVFIILFGLVTVLSFSMYISAPFLSDWIGDHQLESIYRLAALTFFVIPFLGVGRGVFQGLGDMQPTAYSQVSEQIVRVLVIVVSAVWFSTMGGDIYTIGKAAVLASLMAGFIAFAVLSYFAVKRQPLTRNTYPIPWRYYMKTLFTFGLFFALNHMVLLIIQFADTFTLFPRLLDYGLDTGAAMEAKGIFDRGQPFIQLGTVLGSAFALALIPRISPERLHREPDILSRHIRSALSFSVYMAFGATLGLILIFPEANQLLYKNTAGTGSLQVLVIAILLSSLVITGASILQGLGYMKVAGLSIICAFFVKWGLNDILVPLLGIMGSALATTCSLLFLTAVLFYTLYRKLPELAFFRNLNWRALILSGAGMTIYIMVIDFIVTWLNPTTRLDMLIYVVFIVLSAGFIYLYVLLKCKALSEEELAMLPLGTLFIRIQRGRHSNGSN